MDMSRFTDLPVIDCHTHFLNVNSDKRMLEMMNKAGFHKIGIVSGVSREKVNFNPEALYLKAKYPDRFFAFGGLDYSAMFSGSKQPKPCLPEQVETLIDVGFDGIKMVEGKPTLRKVIPIPFDSDFYGEYFSHVESLNFPIVFHVNDPEEFWDLEKVPEWAKEKGWFYDATYPQKEQLYAEVENVLDRFPDLKVIFAHFYFLSADLERAASLLDRHRNVHLDLAPGIEMYHNFSRNRENWREFFIRYQDRIIYGTDICSKDSLLHAVERAWVTRNFLETDEEFFTWASTEAPVRGLKLPRSVLEKIYSMNFKRLVGEEPEKLNLTAAISECKRIGDSTTKLGQGKPNANTATRVASLLQQMQ